VALVLALAPLKQFLNKTAFALSIKTHVSVVVLAPKLAPLVLS
jgi:hypothetical protein